MSTFPIHTIDSAPLESRPFLQGLQQNLGMIPNLAAAMAESPELFRSFLTVREIYHGGTLTPVEVEVLSLTSAFENQCTWCMTFHTRMARIAGLSQESLAALREGRSPVEPRLGALSEFARKMVRRRGAVEATRLERFFEAGYSRSQALEVVLGMAFSMMANYASHLTKAPVEESLKPHAWQPPS